MDDNALAALKAVYGQATEGEWEVRTAYTISVMANRVQVAVTGSVMLVDQESALANAEFIVAAHTHVPALLAEVERLREALKGIDGYILHNHELFGDFDSTNAARIRVMVADALNTDAP